MLSQGEGRKNISAADLEALDVAKQLLKDPQFEKKPTLVEIKLKNIFEHADKISSSILEDKIKSVLKSGRSAPIRLNRSWLGGPFDSVLLFWFS